MKRPYLVGVVGGTGSGKTTVADGIVAGLPSGSVATLCHDSYYKPRPDLSPEDREKLNFDHPDALENDLLLEHLDSLLAGRAIEVPSYDFSTHLRRESRARVEPAPIVLVEGILLFADARLRAHFDLKLFVDTDADLRVLRRVTRDLEERGRSFSSVRDQYFETVRPMHLQFVEPTKRYADVIIPEGGRNLVALDLVVARLRSVLLADD